MPDVTHDDEALLGMLDAKPCIAVVGASDNPDRDSNRVFRYLLDHGFHVVPVNPMAKSVCGVTCVSDLQAARAALGRLDIVDVFRSPDKVMPIVDEAIGQEASVIWFQLGVVNHDANARALQAGIDIVVDRCIKIEHARLVK